MKHIVFLTLTLTRGGAERVIANLCNDSLIKNYKVSIITCLNKPIGYELDPAIEYICIEKTSNIHYANLAERFLKRRRALKEVLGKCKPDVLLCFLPEPNYLSLSLKKHFDFPIIISIRNDPAHEYQNRVYRLLMHYFYPKADGYVFQTEQAKEYFSFSSHIMEYSKVIPNPLSKEYLGMGACNEENRQKRIVNVGKLFTQKNQRLLICAFAKIASLYPDYYLDIYGQGSELENLEKLVSEKKITGRVCFKGNVPDISVQIYTSSLFVLSSDYEGMPNALMEAMAMGIPCISTDCPCGGSAFLIKDHVNGILVPVGDEQRLANAMSEMIQDRNKAMQMGIHATGIQEALASDKIHQEWEKYIQKYII